MVRPATAVLVSLLSVFCFSSCKLVNSILHDEEVVAKVGNNMLYKSEVTVLIPAGIPADDSLRLAMQYINSWASDMVYLDVAEKQLSKEQKDVSKELESYRRSLLKYRYEQLYVNERLDTAVTETEVEEYFKAHEEDFRLELPIVRARCMKILAESPDYEQIKELMVSTEEGEWEMDMKGYTSADRLRDYSGRWIDAAVLAEEMETDVRSILPLEAGGFVETAGSDGKRNVAYILDVVPAGSIPPVEFCRYRIEDIILSARKHRLTASLEQELLMDARDKGKFVIY